jgi:hypothetical protein
MTPAELRRYVEHNASEIEKAEAELARLATPVNARVSAPISPQANTKSLDYLD